MMELLQTVFAGLTVIISIVAIFVSLRARRDASTALIQVREISIGGQGGTGGHFGGGGGGGGGAGQAGGDGGGVTFVNPPAS